jgi:hypothetical protein
MKIRGASKQEGQNRTQFERPAPGRPCTSWRYPAWLRPPSTAHGFNLSAVFHNCPDGGVKHPLVQDNWVLQVCLNPMRLGRHFKTKFSTSEYTKIRHFESENSKNFLGGGQHPSPQREEPLFSRFRRMS